MAFKAKMDEIISDVKSITTIPMFTLSPAKKIGKKDGNTPKKDDKMKARFLEAWNNIRYDFGSDASLKKDIPIWILGVCHHATDLNQALPDEEDQNRDLPVFGSLLAKQVFTDFASRPWFTYRKQFPPIEGTNITSDTGWGCMLRTAQMMIAQGLMFHHLGRDWRWFQNWNKHLQHLHRNIISLFIDHPDCPLSIQCLSQTGRMFGNIPGNWYGPNTVAYIMQQALNLPKFNVEEFDGIAVYVAQDCTVYSDDVYDLCGWTKDTDETTSQRQMNKSKELDSDPDTTSDASSYVDEIGSEVYENSEYFVPTFSTDEIIPTKKIVNNMIPMVELQHPAFINPDDIIEEADRTENPKLKQIVNVVGESSVIENEQENQIQGQQYSGNVYMTKILAGDDLVEKGVTINSKPKLLQNEDQNVLGEIGHSFVVGNKNENQKHRQQDSVNEQMTQIPTKDDLNEKPDRTKNLKPRLVENVDRNFLSEIGHSSVMNENENLILGQQNSVNKDMTEILAENRNNTAPVQDKSNSENVKSETSNCSDGRSEDLEDSNLNSGLLSNINYEHLEDGDISKNNSEGNLTKHKPNTKIRDLFKNLPQRSSQNPQNLPQLQSANKNEARTYVNNPNSDISSIFSNSRNSQSVSSPTKKGEKIDEVSSSNASTQITTPDQCSASLGTKTFNEQQSHSSEFMENKNCQRSNELILPAFVPHNNTMEEIEKSPSAAYSEFLFKESVSCNPSPQRLLQPLHFEETENKFSTFDYEGKPKSRMNPFSSLHESMFQKTTHIKSLRESTVEESHAFLKSLTTSNNPSSATENAESPSLHQPASAIILIPVRLGESALNPIYIPYIQAMLSLESSIGIIGGKPKHSLYFVGYQDEYLLHLDPHYCQVADSPTGFKKNLHDYHTMNLRKTNVKKIDPSCCFGFYCRNSKEFEKFKEQCKKNQKRTLSYPMFLIMDGRSGDHQFSPKTPEDPKELGESYDNYAQPSNIVPSNTEYDTLPETSTVNLEEGIGATPSPNPIPSPKNGGKSPKKSTKSDGFSMDEMSAKLNKLIPDPSKFYPKFMRQRSSSPTSRRRNKNKEEESLESQFELL
uniref:uncharacterized protein LOC120334826 n=1 Tax=Styela clava TaxID=7725 RepID=UPI00193AD9FB|nr:uncharacterized protein LOC120334826 [Styela clava]